MIHIYGINSLYEAVISGKRKIDRIFIQKGKKGAEIRKIIDAAKEKNIPVLYEDVHTLDLVVIGEKHQGVIGFAGEKDYTSISGLLALEEHKTGFPFFVVMDEITDTRNVGAIIRSAEAAGADGIIMPQRRTASINSTVAKTAQGALEHIPICRVTNLSRSLAELKENGIWIYGLDARAEKSYLDIDYKFPIAVVVGNEERGLRHLTEQNCDELISIPILGNVESLNVSVAVGVFSYEVVRQRTAGL